MKRVKEHFVTCGQMKILERRADEDGLSYYQMMENAGSRASESILERMTAGNSSTRDEYDFTGGAALKVAEPNVAAAAFAGAADKSKDESTKVQVFCGKGNNGGDGFVVARKLAEAGYDVTVVLVDGEPVTEDSITNFNLIKDMQIKILNMTVNERALMEIKERPDVVIDAIYGTGFHGSLKGNALKSAFYINKLRDDKEYDPVKVFALDIPSGLGGDLTNEKKLETNSVKADYTITFHAKKPVHLQKFAAEYCGEIIVADIGIDEDRLWNVEW